MGFEIQRRGGRVPVRPVELLDAFRAGDGVDMIREPVRTALQELVELDAAGVIGAVRYARTADRFTERDGTRWKRLATKDGDV